MGFHLFLSLQQKGDQAWSRSVTLTRVCAQLCEYKRSQCNGERTPLPKKIAAGSEPTSSSTTEICWASVVWSPLWGRCTASSWNTSVQTHTDLLHTLRVTSHPVWLQTEKSSHENIITLWAWKQKQSSINREERNSKEQPRSQAWNLTFKSLTNKTTHTC